MEEHVVLTKSTLETVKRVFRGKRMKILNLEKDNENLRKAFARRIARQGNLKANQDLTEYVEPASFGHGLEELQKSVHRLLESPQEQSRPVMIHSPHQSTDKASEHQNHVVTASTKPGQGNSQQVNTQLVHDLVSFSHATENQISAPYDQRESPQTTTGPLPAPLEYPQKQRTANAEIKTQHHLSVQQEYVNVQSPSQNTVGKSLFEQKQVHNSQQFLSNSLQQPIPYPHYPAYSQIPQLKPPPSYQNSHCSNISSLSRSFLSNQAPGHQSFRPLNMDPWTYSQVPQQTFPGHISSHHQPPPYSAVPHPSYSKNIPGNQPQIHPHTICQTQFGFNHHYSQIHSQTLQKHCPIEASSFQPQAFRERLPQSYPISLFPYPGILKESSSQGQQRQPHNLNASQREHDLRLNLSSYQSITKDTIQTQSQLGKRSDVMQGTLSDPKYQLLSENVRGLLPPASKEVLPPFDSVLSEDFGTSHALSHDEDNDGLSCQIVYEDLNIAKHQNNYKTFPITESENGCQIANANKTCSLPLVITPPLSPPNPASSTSVQLNSNNVTPSHDSNILYAQNLHTSQSQPLSLKNQLSLSHDCSKKLVEVDTLERSKLNSVNLFIPEQRFEQKNGEIPVKERDSPFNLDCFSDSRSRHLSLNFSDISDDDVSLPRANCSLEESASSSSEELSLSQNSSLVSSVSQSVNNKTTQGSSTSVAMINMPVKTTEENNIASSLLDPCGELQDLVPTENSERCKSKPSVNENTLGAVPSVLLSTSSTVSIHDFQSDVTIMGHSPNEKTKGSTLPRVKVDLLSKNHRKLQIIPEKSLAYIPESLAIYCFVCRKDVKGKDILLHLIFGHLKCKMCDSTIKNCRGLREMDGKESPCKKAVDKSHDFSVWEPNPIDFLCFQIWQHSHNRASGVPSSESNMVKMHKYLKILTPLRDVKPWSSAFRRCQQYADQSNILDSNKLNSSAETGVKDSKGNPATEEDEDRIYRSNNDLLSRVLIEAEVGIEKEEEAVNVSTLSITSKYDQNTVSDTIDTSRDIVNSESCSASISLTEQSCEGSADSELSSISTSTMEESSICSANSKSTYIGSSAVGEVSKGLVKSEPCSTSTSSLMIKSSKDMIDLKSCNFSASTNVESMSVNVKDRLLEGEVQTTILSKGERNSEEEKTNVVVESSCGKLMESSVLIKRETKPSKDLEVVKEEIPETDEIEEGMDIIHSEYLVEESSCSIDHLDIVTEYVTLCNDTSGSESSSHHCRVMSEGEFPSIDETSNRHSQSNAFIHSHEVSDSQSSCSLEMKKNEKCKPSQNQSDGQAGQNLSDDQAGRNQSDYQAGQNQSDSQAGQNQSDGQAGQIQSDGQAGQIQSDGQAGQNQNDSQAGQNQSDSQAGQNQSDGQAGQNQSDGQAGQNQSDGQAGQNQSDGQAGQNQNDGQAGQNQSDGQAGQNQSDGQAVCKVASKDSSSLRDFLTINNLNLSPQKPSKFFCNENHLVINFQAVETSGLANLKYPEECPLCYTVLCPSRFHVNVKSFDLTTCCIGCGLFITIALGDGKDPSGKKKTCKRLGQKHKTGPLVTKKQKLTLSSAICKSVSCDTYH